jgi:hypothetical protein
MPNGVHIIAGKGLQWLATRFGRAPLTSQAAISLFSQLARIGFAILLVFRLRAMSSRTLSLPDIAAEWAGLSLVYILIVYGASFPWYLVTPFAGLAVGYASLKRRVFVYVSLLAMAEMLLYAVLIPV